MEKDEEKKKSGHGGARPGAGRPAISEDAPEKKRNHAFYCTKMEKMYLRAVLEQIREGNLNCTIRDAEILFQGEKRERYRRNKDKGNFAWGRRID